MSNDSPFASDHQIRIDSEADALNVIAIQGSGLIFRLEDLSPKFFELSNGLAGSVFQKFMNYNQRVAIILPKNHDFGRRVAELAREHSEHSHIRILSAESEALAWLTSL